MADPTTDDGSDVEQVPCRNVDARHPLQDDVADGRRQVVTATGGDQFFGEERIAVGPGGDAVEQRRRGIAADDPSHQLGHVGGVEGVQAHVVGPSRAHQFTEGDRQSVGPVTFAGPPRDDEQDGRRTHGVGCEQQQIAGGLVGPVEVLDDDDERPVGRGGAQLAGDPGEEPDRSVASVTEAFGPMSAAPEDSSPRIAATGA